jgi:hypothetical protein
MKRRWKSFFIPPSGVRGLIYIAGVLCMSVSCKTKDRTTMVFGTVKNEINQPIEGITVLLLGEKGILASQSRELTRTKTNKQGEYSLTTDIPKEFHSGNVVCNRLGDMDLSNQYGEGPVFINGQQTKNCCRVTIGQKAQYDFILIRR